MTPPVPSPTNAHRELEDADIVRFLTRGLMIGPPLAYGVSLLLCLHGAGFSRAALMALLPAFFVGPWMGSTLMLLAHHDAPATDTAPNAEPASAPNTREPNLHAA